MQARRKNRGIAQVAVFRKFELQAVALTKLAMPAKDEIDLGSRR